MSAIDEPRLRQLPAVRMDQMVDGDSARGGESGDGPSDGYLGEHPAAHYGTRAAAARGGRSSRRRRGDRRTDARSAARDGGWSRGGAGWARRGSNGAAGLASGTCRLQDAVGEDLHRETRAWQHRQRNRQ